MLFRYVPPRKLSLGQVITFLHEKQSVIIFQVLSIEKIILAANATSLNNLRTTCLSNDIS
jgi:hypothetical protein